MAGAVVGRNHDLAKISEIPYNKENFTKI